MTEPTETAETAPAVARRPVALGVTFTVLRSARVGYPLGLAVTAMSWEVGSGFFGFGINAQPLVDLFISGFSLGYISVFYGAGLVMIVVGVIVGAPLAALVERWLERNRVLAWRPAAMALVGAAISQVMVVIFMLVAAPPTGADNLTRTVLSAIVVSGIMVVPAAGASAVGHWLAEAIRRRRDARRRPAQSAIAPS